jgi:hypothetical protein
MSEEKKNQPTPPAKPPHKVKVTVDSKSLEVRPGEYIVSAFKEEVKVEAAKVLEKLVDGEWKPLDDSATITIGGGEEFMSHVRRGGSS